MKKILHWIVPFCLSILFFSPASVLALDGPDNLYHAYTDDNTSIMDYLSNHPKVSLAVILGITAVFILLLIVIVYNFRRHNKKLEQLMITDPVTHFPNFEQMKRDSAHFVCPGNGTWYLLYTDIQNFKYINDLYGHALGDWVLTQCLQAIRDKLEPGESCCRMDADHFVQIKHFETEAAMVSALRALAEAAFALINQADILYRPIFRTGVYTLPAGPLDLNMAIDSAIYAKQSQSNSFVSNWTVFDHAMRQNNLKERQMEQDLTHAIRDHEFEVWYQNKVDIETQKIVGAEALVRWRHPKQGLLSPGVFIPFFEKNRFVTRLDFYVFETVCQQLADLRDSGIALVPISSNFSRVHFDNWDLPERCTAITRAHGISPSYLEIEITEEGSLDSIHNVADKLNKLHAAGFSLSIDDFGSGISPVQLLYDLPVDVLKMDRSTLDPHDNEQIHDQITKSIVSIAMANGIKVIFEGVETDDQLDMVRHFGGHIIQGYYYSKPAPFASFKKQLAEN